MAPDARAQLRGSVARFARTSPSLHRYLGLRLARPPLSFGHRPHGLWTTPSVLSALGLFGRVIPAGDCAFMVRARQLADVTRRSPAPVVSARSPTSRVNHSCLIGSSLSTNRLYCSLRVARSVEIREPFPLSVTSSRLRSSAALFDVFASFEPESLQVQGPVESQSLLIVSPYRRPVSYRRPSK